MGQRFQRLIKSNRFIKCFLLSDCLTLNNGETQRRLVKGNTVGAETGKKIEIAKGREQVRRKEEKDNLGSSRNFGRNFVIIVFP